MQTCRVINGNITLYLHTLEWIDVCGSLQIEAYFGKNKVMKCLLHYDLTVT